MSTYTDYDCSCRINNECRPNEDCKKVFVIVIPIVVSVILLAVIGCYIAKKRREKRFAELRKRNEEIQAQAEERRRQELEAQREAAGFDNSAYPISNNIYGMNNVVYGQQVQYGLNAQPLIMQQGYPQPVVVQNALGQVYTQPGVVQPGIQTTVQPVYQPVYQTAYPTTLQ
jgi:hypothetical protein